MNTGREFELLGDLAKLLKKYSAEDFERLAKQLSNQEFLAHFTLVLSTTAQVAKSRQKTGETSRRQLGPTDFRASLVSLGATEPEKSTSLLKLYDALMAKKMLPTLDAIRIFTQQAGLSPVTAVARPKAIIELLCALRPLSVEEIKAQLAKIKPVGKEDDRGLAAWTRIILDTELRNKPTG